MCRVLCLIIIVMVAMASFADAPETGSIEGRTVDANGAAVPGVSVTLQGAQGDKTAITGEDGGYRFALLTPGSYTLEATLEGFQTAQTSIPVEAGSRRKADLVMSLGTAETISVIAEAPLVNRYDVSASSTLQAEQAEELSFQARNYQSSLELLPGVVQNANSVGLGNHRPSVNGGLWQENASFIDGVETSNTRRGGGTRIFMPTTALSEVRMDGSGYSAEYGRASGGVTTAIVKSGSNTYHGEFLYVAQNQDWRAEYDEIPLPREDEIIDSYEASIGGPILRDKVWFFGSLSDFSTNQITNVPDGSIVDFSLKGQTWLGKINAQPNDRHSLALTYINAEPDKLLFNARSFDRFTIADFELADELTNFNWNWSINSALFLEAKVAEHESAENRTPNELRQINPNASPSSPLGNQEAYWEIGGAQGRYNAVFLPLGSGYLTFPRDQANVSATWFHDIHEVKAGADFQDVTWESVNLPPPRNQGVSYDESLPGGFVQPRFRRVFLPADGINGSTSQAWALYAQDLISLGEHWVLNLGLRAEEQAHDNDLGQEVMSSTDLAPRLAAVWDMNGDGRLLVKGTAGRYYNLVSQNIIDANLSQLSNGANGFDEFNWNPSSQLYDTFVRTVLPAQNTVVGQWDPYYKDEITAGVEWQFSSLWAFKSRLIYSEVDDIYTSSSQIDGAGRPIVLIANVPEAERQYQALQLEINRAFRNNWFVRSNLTFGELEGNVFGNEVNGQDDDDFLEARFAVDPATGQPLTALNRYGRGPQDRSEIFNLAALKLFPIGRHTVSVSGYASYRSGEPWGLREGVALAAPGGGNITTTVFTEPRDAHELPDTFSLNLTGAWSFPIYSRLEGNLKLEVANVTDEQEPIDINNGNGQVVPIVTSYQMPREFRVLVGLSF